MHHPDVDPRDYGYLIGLKLNLARHFSRMALASAIGAAAAAGGRVRSELFDGIAATEEEAREMARKVNEERDRRKFAAAARQGPMGILGLR